MSTPLRDEQLSAIKDALFQGRKIEAIKLYREATHVGLAESKDAVEKLEQELRTPLIGFRLRLQAKDV